MKVVRLSALHTGHHYPQGHSAAGRIMSMKNSTDTIENGTRDLLACNAVPQPTAPPHASIEGGRATFKCTHKDGQVVTYI